MNRFIKILIESNLFVAISAVAFLCANAILLNISLHSIVQLSVQVFFSTWFVYQFSRWIYFKKGAYVNTNELIHLWFIKHPKFNLFTIVVSGFLTVFFTFYLEWKSLIVLLLIGSISLLYTVPVLFPFGIKTRLRDFPFVKIFLIAFVWSVTSVILPATESHLALAERKDVFILFIIQFLFIFFITLPFDINDIEADKSLQVKTLPTQLGIKASKVLCLVIGIIYACFILFFFMLENWRKIESIYLSECSIISIWILLVALQIFTFLKSDTAPKWIIKLVYDGSMIVYFLILFLL